MFGPGTTSGSVASSKLVTASFRTPSGADSGSGPLNIQCGRSLTLATVRGQSPAQFQADFPAGGVIALASGQEKGIVGWVIELIQLAGPINILFGQQLQSFGVIDFTAHP